jgi:RHS repeat-associated protein
VVLTQGVIANFIVGQGSITTNFDYAGSTLISERSWPSYSVLRRYVHGPGTDEPLVWYEGAGTTDRRWLHADERGSVVAVSNSAGSVIALNSYDEYGIPQSTNQGRFQYTGQTWLPEVGLYYYKARMYSPTLGRFMQTDLLGYAYGMNWYAYVGGDPVNRSDPSGTAQVCVDQPGTRIPICHPVKDEDGDGDVDSNDRAIATSYLRNEAAGRGTYAQQSAYRQIVNAILRDPNVEPSVKEAVNNTIRTGNEWGFWVYFNGSKLSVGSLRSGYPEGVAAPHPCAFTGCWFASPVLWFHTHGNYAAPMLSDPDFYSRFAIKYGAYVVSQDAGQFINGVMIFTRARIR